MKNLALIAALTAGLLPALADNAIAAKLMSKEESTSRLIEAVQYRINKYERAIVLCETAIDEGTAIPENDYPGYQRPETIDPGMLATPINSLRDRLTKLNSDKTKLFNDLSDCEVRHQETVR